MAGRKKIDKEKNVAEKSSAGRTWPYHLVKLPNELSYCRDMQKDIPTYVDNDEFAAYRVRKHALDVAKTIQLTSPMMALSLDVKRGVYNDATDEEFEEKKNEVEKRTHLWGRSESRSILKLCMSSIELADLSDEVDKEMYDYIHSEFRVNTGFDFNEIYKFMNNLSRQIVENPCAKNPKMSDMKCETYADWVDRTYAACWGGLDYIDKLTLYSRLENMLPSVRTDAFFTKILGN